MVVDGGGGAALHVAARARSPAAHPHLVRHGRCRLGGGCVACRVNGTRETGGGVVVIPHLPAVCGHPRASRRCARNDGRRFPRYPSPVSRLPSPVSRFTLVSRVASGGAFGLTRTLFAGMPT